MGILPHSDRCYSMKIRNLFLTLVLAVVYAFAGSVVRGDELARLEVLVYFIDRERLVDETDLNAKYEEPVKLERYILDSSGRGYQEMAFLEGALTGPWATVQTGGQLQFYRQDTNSDGEYIYVPDFSVAVPGGQNKILLVVHRPSPQSRPMIQVVGLDNLRGNEGIMFCNFSHQPLYFKLGQQQPVSVNSWQVREVKVDGGERRNVRLMVGRNKNGEMDILYNTIRRVRPNNMTLLIATMSEQGDIRFQILEP